MESFIHLRKGKPPKRPHADLDGLKDDAGPDQRGTLRAAVTIVTDWLHRHGFSA